MWESDAGFEVTATNRSAMPQLGVEVAEVANSSVRDALSRVSQYPRLRYMGSKFRLVPHLVGLFDELKPCSALDAFSGSGVVGYALKALGVAVTTNDFLAFPAVIAQATIANQTTRLSEADIELITGPPSDDRDFVQRTFDGLYFTAEDRRFLDCAWSNIDLLKSDKKALAISALILSAARKQPRGVFTVTDLRYDDGRRDLRLPLRDHFLEAATVYNNVVFDSKRACRSVHGDVFDLDPGGFDLVYLDPPYAPPRDDNCYIKRYHFLEGLSVYWRGQTILEQTRTKKLAKRYTPFSYKSTIVEALRDTFKKFSSSTLVLSYSSNAVPDPETIELLLGEVKRDVTVREIDHRYHFGTHAKAERRSAIEYLFIGQ